MSLPDLLLTGDLGIEIDQEDAAAERSESESAS
jgi:hypothetical protein